MPTESAFVFAGLLFLAAALGYVFARYGEPPEEDRDTARQADYFRGFRYLLSEEPDRVVEVFSAIPDLDDNTLETHLALGTLFRRRGEIDRAIAVHTNLLERPQLSAPQRNQARLALADDYLAAGLYDRAEELLEPLVQAPEQRGEALSRLLRIAEQTQEWQRAIDLCRRLEGDAGSRRQAHYWCELAVQAAAQGDVPAAQQHLDQARAAGQTIRCLWIAADLAAGAGDPAEAARLYRRVISEEPGYVVDVLAPLESACAAAGLEADLATLLDELCTSSPVAQAAIAAATILDLRITQPVALECLAEFLVQDPVLGELVDADRLRRDKDGQQLARLRVALNRLARGSLRYRCGECGYASPSLHWQCPGCRSWESLRPVQRLPLDGLGG
jgi:lipopolysaccharide biosynthesis regulator YciM